MNQSVIRTVFRWVHIVFSIPIIGYIYSPFKEIPNYAPAVRFFFFPLVAASGLWMWKGHLFLRWVAQKRSHASANDGRNRNG